MKYLCVEGDAETTRGSALGILTGILYLAPSTESGVADVCTSSSPGCREGCLWTSGRAKFTPNIKTARIRKTKELFEDREKFFDLLSKDVLSLQRQAAKRGMTPAVRCNGTSDLPWLAKAMYTRHPDVQFYDYTKHPNPWLRLAPNYDLTFSLSEDNLLHALDALEHGVRVAAVFNVKKGKPFPETWRGYKVIDGNTKDARFLDPKNVIVGLRAKGDAIGDSSGFVQIVGGV
jgi:hypothetical protein